MSNTFNPSGSMVSLPVSTTSVPAVFGPGFAHQDSAGLNYVVTLCDEIEHCYLAVRAKWSAAEGWIPVKGARVCLLRK